jgi:hypothetical protein
MGAHASGSRGAVTLVVAALAAVSTLAVAVGVGNVHSFVDVLDGRTWLSSSGKGELALVNGAAGKAEMRLQIGAKGETVTVAQSSSHLLFTAPDGTVSALALSDFTVSGSTKFQGGSDLQVVLGDEAAFVVNVKKGVVQAIDPATAAPIGSKLSIGSPLALGGVDDADQLWAAATETGDLIPLSSGATGARAGDGMKVAEPDEVLHVSVVAGHPVVVNESRGLAAWVSNGKLGKSIRLRVDGGTKLAVPRESEDSLVPVAIGSKNQILLVRSGGVKAISLGSGKAKLGSPVRFAGRTYVPDLSAGEVVVVADDGRIASRHDVPGGRKGFELFVDDTHVWANAPASNSAVNIDRRDRLQVIEKYDKDAILRDPDPQDDPADPATPPPVRPTNNGSAPRVTVPAGAGQPGSGPGAGPGAGTPTVTQPAGSVPGQPTGLVATAAPKGATLRFTAPRDNGATITDYQIRWKADDGTGDSKTVRASKAVVGNQGTVDIDGLVNGKKYVVSVAAKNSVGPGTPATTAVTPTGKAPSAPGSVKAVGQDDGTIKLTWESGDGEGTRVIGYLIEHDGTQVVDPSVDPNTDQVAEIPVSSIGVALGEQTNFTVRTLSSVGGSRVQSDDATTSNKDSAFTAPGAPGSPGIVSMTATTATISWTAPADNGRQITNYRVLGPDGELTSTNGLSATVSNSGSPTVTVVAVNEAGGGPGSGGLPLAAPTAPTASIDSATGNHQNIIVKYSVDAHNGSLDSCKVTVANQTQDCAPGSGTLTFTVGWNVNSTATITAINTYNQSSNAPGVAANSWRVFGYVLASDINIQVRFRTGPGSSYGAASSGHLAGTSTPVVCQQRGSTEQLEPGTAGSPTGNVWDQMQDGTWVFDMFTTSPNARANQFSPGIPPC